VNYALFILLNWRFIRQHGELNGKLFIKFDPRFMLGTGSIYFNLLESFKLSELLLAIQNRIVAIYSFLKTEYLTNDDCELSQKSMETLNTGNLAPIPPLRTKHRSIAKQN
jgi:hypothetical protein